MTDDERFMTRAFDLARLGIGSVSPNPRVGCVIVMDGKIIGEGWHQRYGEAHAEVNAVNAVADKALLARSAVYVNLEPCSHQGKTPPCADMLIHHRVKKVVISNLDTNPLVAGKGREKLERAGVEVNVGTLGDAGRELNARFFTFIERKRPYVILKWAETSDGFIARENYESKWISNEYSRQLVHQWRGEEDAVLVGSRTASVDDPRLNVRDWSGRNPVRIVVDRHLTLQENLFLFDGSQPTRRYNTRISEERAGNVLVKVSEDNLWPNVLSDLYRQGIQSVMVEGGAQTLGAFIRGNWWDEARVFRSGQQFLKGIPAPSLTGRLTGSEKVIGDRLDVYRNDSAI